MADSTVLLCACDECRGVFAIDRELIRGNNIRCQRPNCRGYLCALRLDTDLNDGWAYMEPSPDRRCEAVFRTNYGELLTCELDAPHRSAHMAVIDDHRYEW